MPASKAQQAATAARRAQAVQMRLARVDHQTIADKLGYDSAGSVATDIRRALEQNRGLQSRNAELLRQEVLMELDRIQAAYWAKALAGDYRAADRVFTCIQRRCELLGLNAPVRVEHITRDLLEAEIARLEQELGYNDLFEQPTNEDA